MAEKYFFDKFFYQKSVTYGYWLDNKSFTDYGDRAKDIITWQLNINKDEKILGISNDKSNYFKIAVIGDSYTWGEGLKNEQRFVKILSDKLNKLKPTEIISLAKPGWNNLDYLNAYQQMKKYYPSDLIIFALVTNDILVNKSDNNATYTKVCLQSNNNIHPVYESNLEKADTSKIADQILNEAWINPTNQCILKNTLINLPTDNTIYFITEEYNQNWFQTQQYRNHLLNQQKNILYSGLGIDLPQYKKYWDNNLWKNFTISSIEGHPNSLANQMYADILYNEIVTNPKWNFPIHEKYY